MSRCRMRRIVSSIAVVSLLAGMAQPVQDAAAAASGSPGELPVVSEAAVKPVKARPDEVSARSAAAAQGSRVRVTSLDDELSTTYINDDGTYTTETATSPIRVRQGGKLVDVDYDLEHVDGGWSPKASPVPVVFSDGADRDAASIGTGTRTVAMSWNVTLPKPTISADTATYDLGDGESLVLSAGPTGFEQSLVLDHVPTSLPKIKLPLDTAGLDMAGAEGGGYQFTNSSGVVVYTMPRPVMFGHFVDPITEQPAQSSPVDTSLVQTADGAELDLSPSLTWLQAAGRSYPVTIDPSVTLSDNGDSYVTEGVTQSANGSNVLHAGWFNGHAARTYIQSTSGISSLAGKNIRSVYLNLYNNSSMSCTARTINAYPLTAGYASSTVWTNRPGYTTSAAYAGSGTFAHGFSSSCDNDWAKVDVTKIVNGWANGGLANHGIQLSGTESAGNQGWGFCSQNPAASTATGTACKYASRVPYFTATYNTKPGAGGSQQIAPSTAGTNPLVTNTTTPKLSGIVNDADGGAMTYNFQVATSTSATSYVTTGAVAGTAGTRATWTAPTAKLVNGSTYYWRLYGNDGTDSGAASGWQAFKVDTTAPTPPPVPTLTLAADKPLITAGESVALTATLSGSTAQSITIIDQTAATTLKTCAAATQCTVSTRFFTGGPHTYVASTSGGSGLTSNTVAVSRQAWTAAVTGSEQVFLVNQFVALTVTTNQNVALTSGSYATYLVDQRTESIIGGCQPAAVSCSTTSVQPDPTRTTASYVAVVAAADPAARNRDDLTDIQTTSEPLELTRAPFAVTLTSNTPAPEAGDRVILTATANQDTVNANVGIYIFARASGRLLQACLPSDYGTVDTFSGFAQLSRTVNTSTSTTSTTSNGTKCVYDRGYFDFDETGEFIAAVADLQGDDQDPVTYANLSGILALSNVVTVAPQIFTLTLTADQPAVGEGGAPATLTATANHDVSRGSFSIYIVDQVAKQVIAECKDAPRTVCRTAVSFWGGEHRYAAVTAYHYDDDRNVFRYAKATSNLVTVKGAVLTISLTADKTQFAVDEDVSFLSTLNNDLANRTNPARYSVYLVDRTANAIVYRCTPDPGDTTCGSGHGEYECFACSTFSSGDPHVYQAVIAESATAALGDANDIQAQSNEITLSRAPWQVQLSGSAYADDLGTHITLAGDANQNWMSSYQSGGYTEIFADLTTGDVTPTLPHGAGYWEPGYGLFIPWNSPQTHAIIVVIAKWDETTRTYYDVQATSNVVLGSASQGATDPSETAGGRNPSEANCQNCAGDPINTFTGAYIDTMTDLGIAGKGPALAVERTFDSSAAARNGSFGRGWSFNYDARLQFASTQGQDPLPPAVTAIQENGSTLRFVKALGNRYLAAGRVTANLRYDAADHAWLLTRKSGERLEFNADGTLTALRDTNDNATTLSYDTAGHLSRATASGGRYLTFSWSNDRIDTVTDSASSRARYTYSGSGDLTSVTGADDGVTRYGYDSAHRITTLTRPAGGITRNTYDTSTGRVTAQTDPTGGITTFAYQGQFPTVTTTATDPDESVTVERYENAQLVSKTLGSGTAVAASWVYSYDTNNNTKSITDPTGAVQRYTYDHAGNTLTSTDPLQRRTTWTYTSLGDVLTTTDPDGETVTATYDTDGNQLSTTTPTGKTQRLTYNPDGTKASSTDADGNTTTFGYDAAGNLTTQTNPAGNSTTFTYDRAGHVTRVTDPTGATVTSTYDRSGHVLTVTDPANDTTTTTYDADGNARTVTDPLGRVTTTGYDPAGKKTTTTDPTGAVTTYRYTSAGDLDRITDPLGRHETRAFDARHNLTSTTDAAGHTTSYLYDGDSRVTAVTTATNAVTRTTYNNAGEVTKTVDANSHATTYSYTPTGKLRATTDPLGRTTTNTYNDDGQLTGTTHPDGSATGYRYADTGQLAAYTDPDGHQTTYTYNASGDRTTRTAPGNRVTRYAYDTARRPSVTTLPNGNTITHTYDASGQLTKRDYSDPATHDVTFSYDAAGQRMSMADATGTSTYSYDPAGRIAASTNGAGARVGYTHNAAGLLTKLAYDGGQSVTYTYNAVQQMTRATDWAGRNYTFAYDDDGALTQLSTPDGVTQTTTRNPLGQPTALTLQQNQSTLASLTYGYNAANELTTDTTAFGTTRSYSYDQLSQLATAQSPSDGPNPGPTRSYAATPGGKLTANDGTSLRYNPAGQLATAVTADNETTTYTYDANGARTRAETDTDNPATRATSTYNYGDDGSLTTAQPASNSAVAYTYDGDGLRHTRTKSGATANFTWATGTSLPTILDAGNHRYVYGPDATPIADYNTTSNTVQYLHHDALGSVVTITDATGNVTAKNAYSPYGSRTQHTGTASSAIGYAGEWTDPDTNLIYLRARDYDPDTGQFMSVDPLVDDTHQPYSYAENNPLQKTDPTGQFSFDSVIDVAKSIGGAAAKVLAGTGHAVTLGLTDKIADLISPGSSCLMSHDGFFRAGEIFGTIVSAIAFGGTGSVVNRFASSVRQLADSGLKRATSAVKTFSLKLFKRAPRDADPGAGARFVAGSDGATMDMLAQSGKLPFPRDLVPALKTPNSYGNELLGVGPGGAKALIGARSAGELRALGVTKQGAERWQDFYANVAILRPQNPSAQTRVELLQDIIETIGRG